MEYHRSLVPLSRDHQLGLLLARRLKRGASQTPDSTWPGELELQRDRTVQFFDTAWAFHLDAEEQFLFPLAEAHLPSKGDVVSLLRKQHMQLRSLIDQLRHAEGVQLENLLLRFAHVLEEHIRKEESVLFRGIQREVEEGPLVECGRRVEDYFSASPRASSEESLACLGGREKG